MATQADLDAIDRAINSGLLKVKYPDNSEFTYRSQAELLALRDRIAGQVNPPATSAVNPRATMVSFG